MSGITPIEDPKFRRMLDRVGPMKPSEYLCHKCQNGLDEFVDFKGTTILIRVSCSLGHPTRPNCSEFELRKDKPCLHCRGKGTVPAISCSDPYLEKAMNAMEGQALTRTCPICKGTKKMPVRLNVV